MRNESTKNVNYRINLIVDIDGTIYNEYVDTINEFIGCINPIRYRGYYYDNETGLYYLNARYYDPSIGRFISLTILDETKGHINGLNLYMYCNNNPIMYVDPSGCLAFFIITAIIGAVIGFGTALYIDYKDDGQIFNGSVKWYD